MIAALADADELVLDKVEGLEVGMDGPAVGPEVVVSAVAVAGTVVWTLLPVVPGYPILLAAAVTRLE